MAIYDVRIVGKLDGLYSEKVWSDLRISIEPHKVHNVANLIDTIERILGWAATHDMHFEIKVHGERLSELPPPKGKY